MSTGIGAYGDFTPATVRKREQEYAFLPEPNATTSTSSRYASASILFDDMMKHYDLYNNCSSENEFIEFIASQDSCRKNWFAAEQDLIRLITENQNLRTGLDRNEKIMTDFRRQFQNKLELVSRLQDENDALQSRSAAMIAAIRSCMDDTCLPVDAKNKMSNILGLLEGVEYRHSVSIFSSHGDALTTIPEAEATDLSMTQSEDDIGYSVNRRRNKRSSSTSPNHVSWKKICPFNGAIQIVSSSGNTEQVVSQTPAVLPESGVAVYGLSTLETVAASREVGTSSQPQHPAAVASMAGISENHPKSQQQHEKVVRKCHRKRSSVSKYPRHPAPAKSASAGLTLAAAGCLKMHSFVTKTVIRPEFCGPCGERIKFSKPALKCKDCKATCHPACRDKVPLPCVVFSTPSDGGNGQLGVIADYTPKTHPMVPALIQHCVNEIEARGLSVVGLYRVPASEKEVKDLKERFLREKGIPNLTLYDPHVICGCVKDFLRSLHEPVVGRWFWRDFDLAADISDPIKRQTEINRTLDELPPPNQDTLAFIILHLQRIAEVPDIKMPIGNLAKVFGTTIIGYSSYNLDAGNMLKETKKQQLILETLLSMPSDYWQRFINRLQTQQPRNNLTKKSGRRRFSSIGGPNGASVPVSLTSKTASKITYFQELSPEAKTRRSIRPKRRYFD